MSFKLVLKDFKLKKLVVEPKMAQLVELDEEPVDRQLNWSRFGSTLRSTSRSPSRPLVQLVEDRSRDSKNFLSLPVAFSSRSRSC